MEEHMTNLRAWALVLGLVTLAASVPASQQQPAPGTPTALPPPPAREPAWAFPIQAGTLPPDAPGPKSVPGSAKKYTPMEIDDLLNPPDWFPDEHRPAPPIVQKGHGMAFACGSCHLMSGLGHPESSDVTGSTAAYIVQQMEDFKSGVRKDYARMNTISKELSDEEIRQAADWFASLPRHRWSRVAESPMVPKTFVGQGRMRFVDPKGGMEPIGSRIITLPEDQERARLRDPKSGFVSYVPPGSIAKGKALVESGGSKTITCSICHGDGMKGLANVPRIAGLHPIYIVRQLHLFKEGDRTGPNAPLMKKPVSNLTDADMLNIAAYVGSLSPE
jgi:cytochrome c553